MFKRLTSLLLCAAIMVCLLSACGGTGHSGTAGSFVPAPEKPVSQEEALSAEEQFNADNTDEYLMWFSGEVIDLREIDPADYYATDEVMHRYRELFPFDPEKLLYETPNSSCFSMVGYDYSREMLALLFRSTGMLYVCYDVPAEVWEDFSSAESLGSYYNSRIKDNYYYEKWE